ncbi:putative porin [uncultured Sphingosinicella sp.]|uniref:putative porin n=1 Tax=uncultured Sphingosinicella sp. TaxID=478748 RepID=UPI0030D995B9|tara:strand:- start:94335 stop:95582 length:1248 start_codon:yes stop_codon:yes gene_type:complete
MTSFSGLYRSRLPLCAALLLASSLTPAAAAPADDIAELKAAVEALRAEQARAQARIAELEGALARQREAPVAVAAAPAVSSEPSRLSLSGDMRVRYESNFGVADARDRDRGVLRARLRAAYAVNDWLTVGGQIATGDPDDPNSTDMTLSNFDDDLQVSLDQAYIRLTPGDLQVHLGKIPQPFMRTELVWDGDVSPQGASAAYTADLGGVKVKASGIYFMVDESVAGPDSRMIGGQLSMQTPSAPIQAELAVGYYDYALRSVAGGDAGDFRSNLFAGGRYLSDFNLLDVIAALTWNGLGEKWPVRLVGDYVHNYGAATDADTGFGVDLLVGRASKPGDWRFTYGYAEAETDAVLAAFSHDNTNIGTNYMQHTLAIDFVPKHNLVLNATYYRYRQKDGVIGPVDWQNRLRLNFLVNF